MKRFVFFSVGFFLFVSFSAQAEWSPLSPATSDVVESSSPAATVSPKIQKLIDISPSSLDMPEDALIFLLKSESAYVHEDGTAETEHHELIKILNEAGKAISDVKLVYNQSIEDLEIIEAKTIKADGRVIPIDSKITQDLAALGRVPLFSDIRVRRFVFPNVGVGDFLEMRYKIRLKKPIVEKAYESVFMYPIGTTILTSEFTINLPSTMKGKYISTLPSQVKPTLREEQGRTIYQWSPPPLVLSHGHELALPPSFDVDPYIFFSTMESWQTLTDWYVPLFENVLKETSPVVASKARQLTLQLEGDRQKTIQALSHFVAQKIEYVAVALGESAWQPYPPEYVLKHGYGDCKGKAGLLISMLRQAGIEAYGALVKPASQGRLIRKVPSLGFTHVIVAIPQPEGGYLYIDPTVPVAPYNYLMPELEDREVIILDRKEPHFEKTQNFPAETTNHTVSDSKVTISKDGKVIVEETNQIVGLRAIEERIVLRSVNPALIGGFIEEGVRLQYPKSKLISFEFRNEEDVLKPMESVFVAEVEGIAQFAGDILLVDQDDIVPKEFAPLVVHETRHYPIYLGYDENIVSTAVFSVPEGYEPKAIPENLDIVKTFGAYKRQSEVVGGELKIKTQFKLKQPVIPASQYQEFKIFVEKTISAEKEKILYQLKE